MYTKGSFFFASYGCCIPTESYAWILVALFITGVIVLFFCMLATATIRWMYKRRMRKRLHDLKKKFLMDQQKAQEFEAKLSFMAQKNKSTKDFSREEDKEKFTIIVDPAKNPEPGNQKKGSQQKAVGPGNGPIYDQDETPIAQSTLNSQSNTNAKMRDESRWLHLPKTQDKKKPSPTNNASPYPMTSPIPPGAPIAPIPPKSRSSLPPKPPSARLQVTQQNGNYFDVPAQKKSPPSIEKSPGMDLGTSPIIPIDPSDISPTKRDALAPPTTVSSLATPSGMTTTPTSGTTPTTSDGSTTPITGTSDSSFTTPFSSAPSKPSPPKNQIPSPPKKNSGDDVKQNLQYGSEDIVSPVVAEKESDKGSDRKEVRKEGAGGRSEWKYYDMKRVPTTSSSITKSSLSNRRSSGNGLFDSTGSNRFDSVVTGSGKTNSTVSSSILKTDSSQYRTASIEKFPHGAFTFQ
uniref:Uncharacterized protein n=1 Tax=Caenorhabditis tropicalis TaxID=1561998 RepID=A0A1I7TAA8_9PELO